MRDSRAVYSETRKISGKPDPDLISTGYVERQNVSDRNVVHGQSIAAHTRPVRLGC